MAMNKYEVIFKTGKKTLVEAKTFVSGITGIMFYEDTSCNEPVAYYSNEQIVSITKKKEEE